MLYSFLNFSISSFNFIISSCELNSSSYFVFSFLFNIAAETSPAIDPKNKHASFHINASVINVTIINGMMNDYRIPIV